MTWSKAGSYTAPAGGGVITSMPVNSVPNSKFYIYFSDYESNYDKQVIQFNGNTSSDYSWRYTNMGDASSTPAVDQAQCLGGWGGNGLYEFNVGYIVNVSGYEKLVITHAGSNGGSGGNAPNKREIVSKWDITSGVITSMNFPPEQSGATSTFDEGSSVSVLGSDGVESLNVQDGAVFYETDTNKSYVLSGTTWSEL